MPAEIVYRSANLLVRVVPAADTTRWVVTFDHYGSGACRDDRPGFGETFLNARGVSVASVLGCGDHWYQYRDTIAALAATRQRLTGAARVMTYGSSMGGHAAIRFADRLGADAVLACSPQYSIHPRRAPWEDRWPEAARTTRFRRALDGPIRCSARVVAIADPHGPDGRHVRRIAQDVPLEWVRLRYTAHPVTTFLATAGLLEPALFALLDDRFDAAAFEAEGDRRRHGSAIVLGELARQQPAWRPRLGVRLAEAAVAAAPGSPLPLHNLALRLAAAGRHDEAVATHEQVAALLEPMPAFAIPYAETLVAAGRLGEARAVVGALLARYPDDAGAHSQLGKILWALGERRAALVHARTARRLSPANRHYRVVLRRWRSEWRRARRRAWWRTLQGGWPPR